MNKTYRLVWNEITGAWVAVAEHVKARGKRSSGVVLAATVLSAPAFAQSPAAPPAPTALPTGGQVVAGQAGIVQSGAAMTINQGSQRAAIDWQTFNIGSQASVHFQQPAGGVALNRVADPNPSQIFGRLTATGQVFLSNPSGIYFSPSASVNVGALVATTHTISLDDFMAGKMRFERNGATGEVINAGELQAALGGYIALLAPEVRNEGVIVASMGTVALAAGEAFELQFDSNNTLASLRVDPATVNALVENKSAVLAPGGLVILSARAVDTLQGSVVNSGDISASSLVSKGGRILLEGDDITLAGGSSLDATGATGGGEVLVGGDWQGSGDMHQARRVTMAQGASIDASATNNGDGGKVVLWSNVSDPDSVTTARGSIVARGGSQGGDGGRVETSGAKLDSAGISVNAGATDGNGGLWLIDPYNYTIHASAAGNIVNSLKTGTSVTVTTSASDASYGSSGNSADNGDITLSSDIVTGAMSGNATLTLQAARHINIAASIDATGNGNDKQLNVTLLADSDRSGDGITTMTAARIKTNGGDLTFGDGSTANIGGANVKVGGDVYISGSTAQSLETAGGDITINGETIVANAAGVTFHSGGGAVTFGGLLNAGNQYTYVDGPDGQANSWDWARSDARNGTAGGSAIGDSYMVTITSRLENAIAGITANYRGAWIGAYRDVATPNNWVWADGPEGGQHFFTQAGGGGTAVSGWYSSFGSGEPNGSGTTGETRGQFFGNAGQWNDLGAGTTFAASQDSQYSVLGYVRETNLAESPVTINAGGGTVTFQGAVGTSKALASLDATGGSVAIDGGAVTTKGVQTYNAPVVLGADTTLSTTQSDIVFNSTVNSDNSAAPRNLTTTITPNNTYYWVDWTSADATHVYGTINVGGETINVTYTNAQGYYAAQLSGGTNYWTGYIGGGFNGASPYTSANVANGPATSDIIQLRYAGPQTLTFSQSVENLAFSVVSMNGNGYGFNQDFTIESYSGYNGAGAGYYGGGSFIKVVDGNVYKLNDGGVNASSVGGKSEPHGTIRFANAFDSLIWNSLSNELWNGFTVGVSGTSATAGTVHFNGAAGATAALGAVTVNAALQTTADISGASSLAVSGRTTLGGAVTTAGNQTYNSAVALNDDAALTTTSNGSVSAISTIDGAHALTIATHGTGDTSLAGALGGTTALTGLSITTDALNANAISLADDSALAVSNAGASSIAGVISGTNVVVTKYGYGTLTLSGANTYSGGTTISGGVLKQGIASTGSITHGAVGTGSVTVANGGSLDLAGYSLGNALYLSGAGVSDSGAVFNSTSTAVTISGATTLSDDASIKSEAGGALTLSGTINGAHALTVDTDGASSDAVMALSGVIGGTTALTGLTVNSGTADATVSGVVTAAGPISIEAGNLNLNADLNATAAGADILAKVKGRIVQAAGIDVTTNGGNVIYWADSDGTGGGTIALTGGASVQTSGGGIWMGGGSGTTTWTPRQGITAITVGDGAASGGQYGVNIEDSSLDAGTGNVWLSGASTWTAGNFGVGTRVYANGVGHSASISGRNIDIAGSGGTGSGNNYGHWGVAVLAHGSATTSVDASGALNLTGNAGGSGTIGGSNHGVILQGADLSSAGDLVLTGTGGGQSGGNVFNDGIHVEDSALQSGAGTLTLSGIQGFNGSSYGVAFYGTNVLGHATNQTGNITLRADTLAVSGTSVLSTATLAVEPLNTSFTSGFTLDGGWTLGSALAGLTLGKSGNTGDVTIASATTVAGPIAIYAGDIAIDAGLTSSEGQTISLQASGNVTDGASGYVSAENLAMLGGNVVLDSASNAVGTLAASGVGSLTYVDGDGLTLGSIGATNGISASGAVSIATLTGDLTVAQEVETTDTTANALVLNAGKNTAAGTASGGNLIITGAPTISVGSGGTAKLFTGSLPGSTGLAAIDGLGSGSGRFRYNSDETSTNYTTALDTGLYAIYREQPTANISTMTLAMTYGDALPDLATTDAVNGDGSSYDITGAAYSTANQLKASSTPYVIHSTLAGLGYNVTGMSSGTLAVNAKALTISGLSSQNKVYDGTTSATVNGTAALQTAIAAGSGTSSDGKAYTGDTVSLTGTAVGNFNDKDVADATTVSFTGLSLTGDDAGNYTLTQHADAIQSITAKALTISGLSSQNKVYDGTTDATVNGTAVLQTAIAAGSGTSSDGKAYTGDTVSLTGTAVGNFNDKDVADATTVSFTGLSLTGDDAGNYTLTQHADASHSITAKALTVTWGGVNKTYDGNTTTTVTLSDDRAVGDTLTINHAAAFADKNAGVGKTVNVTGVSLSGADAGNYTVAASATTTADIARLGSVTWIGGDSGNWFDPANWAGGAVPDLSNVANVIIPANVMVSFDTTGAVAPAETGPVNIDSLGISGGLTQADGTLNIGSGGMTLDSFSQSGGALNSQGDITLNRFAQTGGNTTTNGDFTVSQEFSQGSNGAVTVGGNASITDTSGGVTVGNLDVGGNLGITSRDGDLTQANGTTITVAGMTTVDAGSDDIRLDGANNDFVGPFNAHGNDITVVDGQGGLVLVDITARGNLEASSRGGDLTQANGTTITVAGTTMIDAGSDDIRLDGANNDFVGPFNARGTDITVVDGRGGLVLGDIRAGGDLDAISRGGDLTQVDRSTITVNGATMLDAGKNLILLNGGSNRFIGGITRRDASTSGTGALVIPPVAPLLALPTPDTAPPPVDAGATSLGSAGLTGGADGVAGLAGMSAASDGPPANTPARGGAEAVVALVKAPTAQEAGLITVEVPKEIALSGFSFALPEQLVKNMAPNASISVTLENGAPLPSWLSFVPERRGFTASVVPPSALPLRVVVMIDGRSSMVLITEVGTE